MEIIGHSRRSRYERLPEGLSGAIDGLLQNGIQIAPRASGFDGVGLSFVNYLEELPYFRDEVIARLERMGLRKNIALDL